MKNTKYIQEFLDNLKRQNKSERTLISYQSDLSQFLDYLNQLGTSLPQAQPAHISDYLNLLRDGEVAIHPRRSVLNRVLTWQKQRAIVIKRDGKLGVASQKRALAAIKNLYAYLGQSYSGKKLFVSNPVQDKIHAIKLKDVDTIPTPILTVEHWQLICACELTLDERFIVNLLYYSGMRLSELRGLTVSDFNLENKTIFLKRKGGKTKHLKVINPDLIFGLLNEWLLWNESAVYLFSKSPGKPASNKYLFDMIKSILKRSGVPSDISPHSFRKSCATNLYRDTKDIIQVREYLSHSQTAVTEKYIDYNSINN